MIVCVNCRTEMQCEKTGVGVDYGGGHVYMGDAFKCEHCGAHIIRTNPEAMYDPEYKRGCPYLPALRDPDGPEGAPEDKHYPKKEVIA